MAKVKPATSRKQVKPKEQVVETAADEITTALDQLSEHLSKHLKKYLIGLGAVCVGALAISMFLDMRTKAAVEKSDAASAALAATTDSVATWGDKETLAEIPGLMPPTADAEPVKADHADSAAQLAAVEKAASDASGKVADETAAVVELVKSTVAFQKGEHDAAASAFDAAKGALEEDSSLTPLLLEKQGRIAEAKGDAAAAADAYTKLSGSSDVYFKVRGFVLLGDLKASSDAAAAKAAYASALEQLTAGEGKILPPSLRSLRSEIARRQAQL